MEIRKLETEEKQNTKKLYAEVFSEDSKSFVDYYYEEKLKAVDKGFAGYACMRWVKGMLNIAVIEDNNRDAKILEQCLTR